MTASVVGRRPTLIERLNSSQLWLVSLLVLGLVLRLLGLPFNGMHDLDEIIIKWGCGVYGLGLARGFDVNYGVFSYILYGAACGLAESIARFWWAPYKLFELLFEAVVLWALYLLSPLGRKHWAVWLYWLNPWFILHGAWHGFWEGPHTSLVLLAVVCLARVQKKKLAWIGAGMCLMAAAMFKPQGLVYFAVPMGVYLSIQVFQRRWLPMVWYIVGLILALSFAGGLLALSGGGFWQIPANYLSAANVMANLCNGCLSIWRPITIILYAVVGPTKFDGILGPHSLLNIVLTLLSFGAVFLVVAWQAWRVALTPGGSRQFASHFVLTLSGLLMPQFTTHAHINHTYAALVLLIPFIIANRRMMAPWVIMIAIHLYSHLVVYHLGRASVMPELFLDFAPAQPLLARINAALVAPTCALLLQFQDSVNEWIRHSLPVEPMITQLAMIQFVCVMVILHELFAMTRNRFDAVRSAPNAVVD